LGVEWLWWWGSNWGVEWQCAVEVACVGGLASYMWRLIGQIQAACITGKGKAVAVEVDDLGVPEVLQGDVRRLRVPVRPELRVGVWGQVQR